MDTQTYMKETARTWNTSDPHRLQLCNAALGLVGELGEFVRRPSADELGDCYYYAVTINRLLKEHDEHACIEAHTFVRMPELADYVSATQKGELALMHAARVAEYVKKLCFHDKADAATDVALALQSATDAMLDAAIDLATTPPKVMQQNIDKLRERHPDGWDPQYTTGGEL